MISQKSHNPDSDNTIRTCRFNSRYRKPRNFSVTLSFSVLELSDIGEMYFEFMRVKKLLILRAKYTANIPLILFYKLRLNTKGSNQL